MSNKNQQKPTFTLISDHRLIGFNCNLKLGGTTNHSGLFATAPAKEASGLPSQKDFYSKLCQGPRFLKRRSRVDVGDVKSP